MTREAAANRAYARRDFETFDLISLSAREEDRTIQNMTNEELEALMAKTTTPVSANSAA